MAEVWIANASPVILLAKVGLLSLLDRLPEQLILPNEVAREIRAGPTEDAARQAVTTGWATRRDPAAIDRDLLEWGLGSGESAVIALAAEHSPPAVALLDDRLGRSAARAQGVPVLGTLGVLVRAKRAGILANVGEVLSELQRAGLYLHPSVIETALQLAGER